MSKKYSDAVERQIALYWVAVEAVTDGDANQEALEGAALLLEMDLADLVPSSEVSAILDCVANGYGS